ncbi:MAG: hypothetical protein JSS65_08255, partial [Armatimonadetes bacterium]|nr:hypothetical protein [Armatimonadota bacterium]
FTDLATGLPAYMEAASIDVAPQELACDTSSFLRISGYNGATLVGTRVDSAPGADSYTWPGFTLTLFTTDLFDPTVLFDRVVVSFESAPSTGGDWGPIFVADNFNAYPIPEPTSLVGAGLLTLCALRRRASGKI